MLAGVSCSLPALSAAQDAEHAVVCLSFSRLTTPIIALVAYDSAEAQWMTALWRMTNILIAIGIDLVVSLLIPVRTRTVLRNRVQVRPWLLLWLLLRCACCQTCTRAWQHCCRAM